MRPTRRTTSPTLPTTTALVEMRAGTEAAPAPAAVAASAVVRAAVPAVGEVMTLMTMTARTDRWQAENRHRTEGDLLD